MSHEEFNANILDYYLMIEAEFIETFKYVEPVRKGDSNEKAYSKKYIELLLSICSQIDLVCK